MHLSTTWNGVLDAPRGADAADAAMRSERLLAASIAVLLAVVGAARLHRAQASPRDLVDASAPPMRGIEARISGGFPWRPLCRTVAAQVDTTPQQKAVAADLLKGQDSADASRRHAAAIAALVLSKPRVAIRQLEAVVERTNTAAIWSDLAAAYIARADETSDPLLLPDAVAAADAAIALEPSYREPLFNRALALEHLGLSAPALVAWYRFLREGGDDGWSAEARAHLDALKASALPPFEPTFAAACGRIAAIAGDDAQRLVARFPKLTRVTMQTRTMTQWAERWSTNRAAAERGLLVSRRIADEFAVRGDRSFADYISAIDRSDEKTRAAIAAAQLLFSKGALLVEENPTAAEPLLRDAAVAFSTAYPPMSFSARRQVAKALFEQNRIDEAHRELDALLPLIPPEALTLRGDALWQFGLCEAARSHWDAAISAFTESAAMFDSAREGPSAAAVRNILAQVYDVIGDSSSARTLRVGALRELGRTPDVRMQNAVAAISRDAAHQHRWRVALSFIDIELRFAPHFGDVRADSLLRRAAANHFLQRDADAAADLTAATNVIAAITDPELQTRWRADAMAVVALLAASPADAVEKLTAAIDFHGAHGRRMYLPGFFLERGLALRRLGDSARAQRDFDRGIAELEESRETLADAAMRTGIFDSADGLFTEAIDAALSRGATTAAFAYAERARARALLDRMPASPPRDLDAGWCIVEIVTVRDRVILFVKTGQHLQAVPARMSAAALAADAAHARDALSSGREVDAERSGRVLYDALIAPIARWIPRDAKLLIVPDASTMSVSFAALRDVHGRPLIEDHVVSVAPSAGFFLRTAESRTKPRDVLVIAPATSNDVSLAWNVAEATAVASSYPAAESLVGPAATRAALIRAVQSADVIHFAGHGTASSDGAATTSLLLSGAGVQLSGRDIESLLLRRNAVVVLASCNSARGEVRWSEGALSVARAFLIAGAPSVISTLRPIDDEQSADFFPRLHHHLAAGESPAEALRATQLEFIHRSQGRTATIWASVQAIGR